MHRPRYIAMLIVFHLLCTLIYICISWMKSDKTLLYFTPLFLSHKLSSLNFGYNQQSPSHKTRKHKKSLINNINIQHFLFVRPFSHSNMTTQTLPSPTCWPRHKDIPRFLTRSDQDTLHIWPVEAKLHLRPNNSPPTIKKFIPDNVNSTSVSSLVYHVENLFA